MKVKLKLITLLTLIGSTAFAMDLAPKHYKVNAGYNFSKISGFVQIPKGGQFGTTSNRRPTFSEMGITKLSSPQIEFQADWENFSTYARFNYINFKGSATLKEDLITHSKTIEKGSQFKTEHTYKNYVAGLKYNLYANEYVSVHPLVEYSLYDFSYNYNATTPSNKEISSERTFHWPQVNLGLEMITPITEKYSITTTFKYSVAPKKVREYVSLAVLNKYTVFENNNQKLNLFLGVGASKLEFRDTQRDRQNYIVHRVRPNITAGLEFEF